MKEARIATKAELNATAKKMKSKAQAFGKDSSDKFAKEAKSRLDAFCRRTRV